MGKIAGLVMGLATIGVVGLLLWIVVEGLMAMARKIVKRLEKIGR
jgi:hypothetical protein